MKIHKKFEISAGKTSTIYKHEKKPRAISHPLILKKTRKMREKQAAGLLHASHCTVIKPPESTSLQFT